MVVAGPQGSHWPPWTLLYHLRHHTDLSLSLTLPLSFSLYLYLSLSFRLPQKLIWWQKALTQNENWSLHCCDLCVQLDGENGETETLQELLPLETETETETARNGGTSSFFFFFLTDRTKKTPPSFPSRFAQRFLLERRAVSHLGGQTDGRTNGCPANAPGPRKKLCIT